MDKAKIKSHVQIMKTKYRLNKSQVIVSTGITEDEYNVLLFERAVDYIKYRVCNDDDVINKVTAKPMWWAWWQNQWNLREDEFITDNISYIITEESTTTQLFLKDVWLKVHEVSRIIPVPSHALLEQVLREVADELTPKKEVTL